MEIKFWIILINLKIFPVCVAKSEVSQFIQAFATTFAADDTITLCCEETLRGLADLLLPNLLHFNSVNRQQIQLKTLNDLNTSLINKETVLIDVSVLEILRLQPRLDSDCYLYSVRDEQFELFELYSIQGKNSTTNKIGSWDAKLGFTIDKWNKWDRRFNISQAHIKVVAEQQHVFTILPPDYPSSPLTEGYVGTIFTMLQERTGFSASYCRSVDGEWGFPKDDGTVTGMVGMLHRNEAEIALVTMTMNLERFECK